MSDNNGRSTETSYISVKNKSFFVIRTSNGTLIRSLQIAKTFLVSVIDLFKVFRQLKL